jgi:nitrogen-specific signal transduction histidine kinase
LEPNHQLLVNLVSNALKFTHHGRVVLRIKQIHENIHGDGHAVSVEVCDTGVGISAQEQVFMPVAVNLQPFCCSLLHLFADFRVCCCFSPPP